MIVGLCGFAQSGKNTLADMLTEKEQFKQIAFADKMKKMLAVINPYVRYTNDHGAVHFLRVQEAVELWGWEDTKKFTEVREMLQRLGTEGGREILGENIWVASAFNDVTMGDKNVVFTDVRFENEARAIKYVGGIIIRIVRNGVHPVNGHSSETAYIGQDYIINNDGTPSDMYEQFRKIINEYQ